MFPERVAWPPPPVAELPEGPPDHEILHWGPAGVVTFVDAEKLVKLAKSADAVIELVPRVGDFVPHAACRRDRGSWRRTSVTELRFVGDVNG